MYIYYIGNTIFRHSDVALDYELVSNKFEDMPADHAYLLSESETEFKLKYPMASIEEVWEGHLSNERIEKLRERAYKKESDSLFIASQKYAALGNSERSEEMRNQWLEKVAEIDARYPYYEEVTE